MISDPTDTFGTGRDAQEDAPAQSSLAKIAASMCIDINNPRLSANDKALVERLKAGISESAFGGDESDIDPDAEADERPESAYGNDLSCMGLSS